MPRWINVPNALTMSRLALVPFVVRAVLEGRHRTALALFCVAAVTDVLDGATARRFGLGTQAGAYLDPIADKFLLSGLFLALAAAGIVPWWLVAVILGRDLYILAGAIAMLSFTALRKFPPSVWGKLSTFVQILTAAAWLIRNSFGTPATEAVAAATIWPCAAFTAWSGVHYTWRALRILRAPAV
jgi:cardiolipin synthase (CMP-forming)